MTPILLHLVQEILITANSMKMITFSGNYAIIYLFCHHISYNRVAVGARIHGYMICDGIQDCKGNEDETFCPKRYFRRLIFHFHISWLLFLPHWRLIKSGSRSYQIIYFLKNSFFFHVTIQVNWENFPSSLLTSQCIK